MNLLLFVVALTRQLEALQLAVNNAARALNARGDLLANRLQDIPVRAKEVALHGVHRGATVTLMMDQVNSGHEHRWFQPSFASGDDHHELVGDFVGHADVVANSTLAKGIINNIFFSPLFVLRNMNE